ncbi:hypothetical protein C0W35_22480 [Photobacterium kishitanii]|uniref:SMI1/KNR4 family protein n=1 Tax=Photobacterium kishitanii TaxID=318456 RepID=UPI000D165A09|nr:SMI1/KNR4 family protein [Photobacterium kishitanii]PSU85252.1 hypothetical protein C0W35_22480 [Photobacterium kishitanii]
MSLDWKVEISKMVYVKQVISKLDTQNLWPHHLPHVAASNDDIVRLVTKINKKLPYEYKEFLKVANGWPGFYQFVDIFGTEDYYNKDLMSYVKDIFEQTSFGNINSEDLIVIAITLHDIDMFCLNVKTGEVVWFAGEEIERFDNFDNFFLAMEDYNREEIEDLKADNISLL